MSLTNLAYKEKEYETFENDYESFSEKDLSTPIFVDLSDNGGKVTFKTFADSASWAGDELDAWRYIAVSASPSQRNQFLTDIIAQQLSPAENILEASKAAIRGDLTVTEASAAIRRYLDAYAAFCCVHSKSTLGQMALTMERYRPMVLGMLAGATGCVSPEAGRSFNKSSDAEAFTFGYALALQFRASARPEAVTYKVSDLEKKIDGIVKRLNPSEHNIDKLSEEVLFLQKEIDELKTHLTTLNKSKDNEETLFNNDEDDSEEVFADFSEAEPEEVKSGAVDYWLEIARMHSNKASQSLGWFVITGLFSITAIIMMVIGLQKSGFIIRGHFDFATFAALGTPVFVSFVLLAMFAFAKIQNDKLANKAREKIALIETVTAFDFDKNSNNQRIIEEIFKKIDG